MPTPERKTVSEYHYLDPNRPPRRPFDDDDETRTARRFFGWDFTLVVFFLTVALYFFWPRMFKTPEAYAPESAIQETLATFLDAKERSAGVVTNSASDISEKIWLDALLPIQRRGVKEPRVLLWKKPGEIVFGQEEWPKKWNVDDPPFLNGNPPSFVYRNEGIASLVLFEPLATGDLYLIVVKRFKPVFK